MSTAATNQTVSSTDVPLGAVPAAEGIPLAVQAELTTLRNELTNTKTRLTWLESMLPVSPAVRRLMPPDSPESMFALQLASETFPGSSTTVEILSDPAEPNWPWYCLMIRWDGPESEVIDRELLWHQRMSAAFPHLRDEFRLSIC